MSNDDLTLFLFRNPAGVDRRSLDSAVTGLLLTRTSFEVFRAALDAVDEGRLQIDARMITALYATIPPALKPDLASSTPATRLPPGDFDKIFRDAYAREMTSEKRRNLAHGLEAFLFRNAHLAEHYRREILELMRCRSEEVCVAGLALAGRLDDLAPADLEFIRRKLSARNPYQRMNALNAFARMLRRPDRLAPLVLGYVRSGDLISKVKELRRADPEEDVRTCARNLLEAWRDYPSVGTSGGRRRRWR